MHTYLANTVLLLVLGANMCWTSGSSDTKNDMYLLKKLLFYRSQTVQGTTPLPPDTMTGNTLLDSVTTTELSLMVSRTNGTTLMDDLYNTIFTGNGTFAKSLQSIINDTLPNLRLVAQNSTDRLTRQRALVELAVKMQPMIRPLTAKHPNITAQVTALGELIGSNRTARDGGGGGGGGWGSSCCCCGWGGGWGGGGGGGGGGGDLVYYLLARRGGGGGLGGGLGGDGDLNSLLPYLFGLIALLIMKLPT